ncbi:holo-[acyl-carrier protein] synthase [Metamycoplasma subdolum]|uniref:Holo-[acyl-carrier protein] synthase n=1 Tax=Metamycoplasma subdolum TaxID=92407 RepID=A0A3L9ZZB5_9BACT|nr:4'-phosphopantetheinyl transferase superfamily protein [Metamycoplasma subdolum]RMA77474.1 holo-[acyl-carrier protein] synthase [Metamycoplasma subdolum]WPB50673.1 4'-phosphopantetheinyl transferase superfamily protein [Metamycoplasma subdolum]
MIGIDLTNIKRFENLSLNVIKKILHKDEFKEFEKTNDKAKFLATRWAIKEAIFKADNQFKDFSKVFLKKDEEGRYIFLDFEISTSKEDDYIIAIAKK